MLASALAAVVTAAAGSAAGATQRDALVRPGVSIGKIRLGMTFVEVRRGLGRPMFVNRRERLGFGRVYVEYAWSYAEWLVGFQSERRVLRVVRISTTLRNERTRDGIGVGTRVRANRPAIPECAVQNAFGHDRRNVGLDPTPARTTDDFQDRPIAPDAPLHAGRC